MGTGKVRHNARYLHPEDNGPVDGNRADRLTDENVCRARQQFHRGHNIPENDSWRRSMDSAAKTFITSTTTINTDDLDRSTHVPLVSPLSTSDLKSLDQISTSTATDSTTTLATDWSAQRAIETQSSAGYVTQEALPVRDTSFSALPKLQQLLAENEKEYADIFVKSLLSAAGDASIISQLLNGTMGEQTFDEDSYVESVTKRKGRPFLFTGDLKSRTKKNCYLIRANDGLPVDTHQKIQTVLEALGGDVKNRHDTQGLAGFNVCFADKELPLALLKSITGLVRVERDQYTSFQYVQEHAPWQLVRLNNEASKVKAEGPYHFNATGKGVNVYTIDSGVMPEHPEFGGRASLGYTIFADFPNDCAGHGTQVASVIAGINVGVAKQANIISVQVLDCDGQGENSAVLTALNWIIANHVKPAVINMSVGGPKSPSVDEAVKAAVAQGIPVVVAAGNSQVDACLLSPSGVGAAMVVGAASMDYQRASFSNYGSCVDVFAPGQHIIAAALPSQATHNGFTFVSGTSLSAPLVTGLYALFLEVNPSITPTQLKEAVTKLALSGKMDESTLSGSPNLMAQTPDLPETPNINLTFLPVGGLPIFGLPTAGPSTLELVMIIIGAVLIPIFLILILVILIKRSRRKREERRLAKAAMAFR
jgi:subtilisin family serine protease